MSDLFILIDGALGPVCLVFHVFAARKNGNKPALVGGISLITSGVGLLTGIKICRYAYFFP